MSELKQIQTTKAPAAVGPYSQGIAMGDFVFASGCIPLDPATKTMPEGIKAQATQALENVKAVLEAAGTGMDRVVKAMVLLTDINDFAAVNEVYATYFSQPFPARSCFAVVALPLGAKVEIEVIAAK